MDLLVELFLVVDALASFDVVEYSSSVDVVATVELLWYFLVSLECY